MWRSAKAAEAGFTLVEVLAAIVIAGLMVAVLSRALIGASAAARAPADVVDAATLARHLLAGMRAQRDAVPLPGEGRSGGFAYRIETAPLAIEPRAAPVPPLPGGAAAPVPAAVAPGGAGRSGTGPPVPVRITVTVWAPSGRSVRLESVKLVPGPR